MTHIHFVLIFNDYKYININEDHSVKVSAVHSWFGLPKRDLAKIDV